MSFTYKSNPAAPSGPEVVVITDAEVQAAVTVDEVAAAIERAFEALAHGRASILPRQRIDCGPVKLSGMGAIWLDAGLAGQKVYPTVDGQFGFLMTLFDTRSGQPLAVFPGQALTALRTPALTLAALRRALSHGTSRPRKLALFGAGHQGRAHLQALLSALPFDEVAVVDPQDPTAACAAWREAFGRDIHAASAEAAVRGADAVVTVTRSKTPVFDGRWLKPGATVAAIGTSLPSGRELDDTTLARAARVVVEWKPQSLVEAGEVVLGLQSGALQPERIVDWTDLVQGRDTWRRDDDEIVVFKSVGVGLSDLAAASLAWAARSGRPACTSPA
ncbi:MAG: ornithine cyclodeaminase family protein [Rubrivivax sp.]